MLGRLKRRLRALRRKDDVERELDEELRFHLERDTAQNLQNGMSPEEARFTAMKSFGGFELAKEECRDARGIRLVEKLLRDLRFGGRMLARNKGFTIIAVLSLALVIGANTAIFSVLNSVMLQPLPFAEPDQLVRIYSTTNGGNVQSLGYAGGPSPPDARDFSERNHTFQSMVVYDSWRKNVSFVDSSVAPEQFIVGLVPSAYFETLRIQPLLGRLFTEDENHVGSHFVAAISERIWQTRFGGDKAILTRKIRINDELYDVVAVMPNVIPDWMERGLAIEIWTPFAPSPKIWSETARGDRGAAVLGRLRPGVSIQQAQTDLSTIAAGLAATYQIDRGIGVSIKPLADSRVGALRQVLLLLMGAVGLILLIACSNLANLLLARNTLRQREFALRFALGEGRTGLIRQLLTETLLLTVIGAVAGLALAQLVLSGLSRVHPDKLPQLSGIHLDFRVLLFTIGLSALTSLLFGTTPALAGIRLNLAEALKAGGRSGTEPRRQRLRNSLVVAQMALSLMLLLSAALLFQSILRLTRQDLGIGAEHVLKGHVYLPPARYADSNAITRFSDQFAERVRALPGVLEASVTTIFPPDNGWNQMFTILGHPAPARLEDVSAAQFGLTDAHFLSTLRIPLLRGRDFSQTDLPTTQPVALISDEFARRYLPNEDPIGRRIHIGSPGPGFDAASGIADSSDVTIIGVTGGFKNAGLKLPPQPQILVLYAQHPIVNYGFKDIVIRTTGEPHSMEAAIREQLRYMDSDMPLAEVQTIDELVTARTGPERFTTLMLSAFAIVGLALAVIGTYGVISYLVSQRTRELAVRLALGARPLNILWLILRQGLKMAVVGAAVGVVGAWAAQRLMGQLLFGISATDPITFAGGATLLLAVASIASGIPGIRAMIIDPLQALRED
jgi:putative ABC transport system permease protein